MLTRKPSLNGPLTCYSGGEDETEPHRPVIQSAWMGSESYEHSSKLDDAVVNDQAVTKYRDGEPKWNHWLHDRFFCLLLMCNLTRTQTDISLNIEHRIGTEKKEHWFDSAKLLFPLSRDSAAKLNHVMSRTWRGQPRPGTVLRQCRRGLRAEIPVYKTLELGIANALLLCSSSKSIRSGCTVFTTP